MIFYWIRLFRKRPPSLVMNIKYSTRSGDAFFIHKEIAIGKGHFFADRAYGYKGLCALDGAMVNSSTGEVNPALTISALPKGNIEKIIQEDR